MGYCTNCGNALGPAAKFCTSCGTPAAVAETTPSQTTQPIAGVNAAAAASPATTPIETSYPGPVDFPSQASGRGKLVFVLGIIALAVAAGAFFYFHVSAKPGTQAPGVALSPVDAYIQSLNLAAYPGSTPVAVASAPGQDVVAAFHTRDSADQVIGFYKVRFPMADISSEEGKSELRAALPNGGHMRIRAESQGSGTDVWIISEP